MTPVQAFFLGIVQGLTEFLPVSSSGHLTALNILMDVERRMGLDFIIISHFGSLCAVFVVFRKDIAALFQVSLPETRKKLALLFCATLPAVIAGFALKGPLDDVFENNPFILSVIVIAGWLITAATLIRISRRKNGHTEIRNMSRSQSLIIGLAQAIAIVPGISRSGMTVAAGIHLGLNRDNAARFSFLLSIPVILGATLLSLIKMLARETAAVDSGLNLCIGWAAAFASGYLAIRVFLRLIRKGAFAVFGYYCIIAAVAFGLIRWLYG